MTVDDERWAAQRQSFGAFAGTYDAHRPEWPDETARWLTGRDAGGPLADRGPLRVLDLGAGTGKLTRTLLDQGHDVVAVDSSEGMLDVLRQAMPAVTVHAAPAERLPLPDASFDAVTVAQAWHWFDAPAVAAECARVLRPGGVLGIAWHTKDVTVPWVRELTDVTLPEPQIRDPIPPLPTGGDYDPVAERQFAYHQPLDRAGLVALASSWSYVALSAERDRMLADVGALADRVPDEAGRLVLPHVTRCYRARRR